MKKITRHQTIPVKNLIDGRESQMTEQAFDRLMPKIYRGKEYPNQGWVKARPVPSVSPDADKVVKGVESGSEVNANAANGPKKATGKRSTTKKTTSDKK